MEFGSAEVDRRAGAERPGVEVIVVGAGPSGSAAAAWAARAGREVLVIDSQEFPRDKACGDGLTPRAVLELQRLGLGDWLEAHIRHHGLRLRGVGGSAVAGAVVPWLGLGGAADRARRPDPQGGRGLRGFDAAGCESR